MLIHFDQATHFGSPELAEKLRDQYPRIEATALAEYLNARQAFELSPTPPTLERLVTAANLLALPTIDLDQL